jgi:hypothetical protein
MIPNVTLLAPSAAITSVWNHHKEILGGIQKILPRLHPVG